VELSELGREEATMNELTSDHVTRPTPAVAVATIHRRRSIRFKRFSLAASMLALVVVAGCQSTAASPVPSSAASATATTNAATPTTTASSASAAGWTLVALGDSETTGSGDPSGDGWVEYYAGLIRERAGHEVAVHNLAMNGTTSDALLASVKSDASARTVIEGADIIVLGIGGADLNAGDAAKDAGTCEPKACYDAVASAYAANIDKIAAEVQAIRGGRPTVVRAITFPNVLQGAESAIPGYKKDDPEMGLYEARGLNAGTCAAMKAHGGQCVDVLTAINGATGMEDGYAKGLLNLQDCCYPNEKGHRVIAQLLYESGFEPLVSR
jgi:lysophospholipase L1-like esterase